MRLWLFGCVALGLLWGQARGADQPATTTVTPPAREKFQLYLLIGQSNMAGRGAVEAEDQKPHPRVLTFTKDKTWAPAVDPLHSDKATAGVGLGSSFARAMAEANPNVTIGLIPCAVGGTPLVRWQKEGDLWQQAVERAKLAMRDGTLRGVLWHQGEADSAQLMTAETYAARLSQMVRDLRVELGTPDVPFVAGRLGEFLLDPRPDGRRSHWRIVNEQLDQLPKLVARTAVVDSAGLKHKGDDVHFDSPSLRTFGRRYADAMLKLQATPAQ
jgi:hypothetical protein